GSVTAENGGTVSPGGTVAAVLPTGALTLEAGSSYRFDLGGTSPGSGGYDQIKVTGTVDLTRAKLDVHHVSGFLLQIGQTFTIIDNDSNDSVIGTFAQGSTVVISGITLDIKYNGGDGNDVVLTVAHPTTTFVDDSWASTTPGDAPANHPVD